MDENEMTVDQVMNIIYDWFAGPDAKAKTTFSEWYKQHKDLFKDWDDSKAVENDEHNQEYFAAYKNYESMVEKQIEGLLEEHEITKEQFEEALVVTKENGNE